MKLEQQVCSLDLSVRLKELGVKQESLFYWDRLGNIYHRLAYRADVGSGFMLRLSDETHHDGTTIGDFFSAFTVAELGEMLPEEIEVKEEGHFITISRGLHSSWTIGYRPNGSSWVKYMQEADTEANARAKMLVYLLENGLISPMND